MGRLSLLSLGLFILPIAITVGVLVGVETYRLSHGQHSLGGTGSYDNAITVLTNCEKAYGISPLPGYYTYNPNQWGLTASEASGLCMNISSWDNGTYPTNSTSPKFTATWQYPQGPEDEPVHAFPNAKMSDPSADPVLLADLATLVLDVAWTYGIGNTIAESTDLVVLAANNVNANVCVDMFLDSNQTKSSSTTESNAEVMVWLGRFGAATDPIGVLEGVKKTDSINGTNFDLFYGSNSNGQNVFTWVAESNTTSFVGDIGPLLQDLATFGGPTTADYLGYVAFGSEALYSGVNVTFSVSDLRLEYSTS